MKSNFLAIDVKYTQKKLEENGEPSGLKVEHLLASIIKTYYKLQELGFTYYKGKIVVIETVEVPTSD
jgi:hypothetical protein